MTSAYASDGPQWTVHADRTGVVHLVWAHGLHVDTGIAQEAKHRVDELNAGRERPLLVDMTGATLDRGARTAFAERCSASRVALLGRSAVDRLIVNFALSVITQPVPTRYFTSGDAALAWLRDDSAA